MAIISSAFAAEGEQETHESVGAGEAHHEGAFPPFQTENFAPQIFWLVVIFGLLYVLMSHRAAARRRDHRKSRRKDRRRSRRRERDAVEGAGRRRRE